MRWTIKYVYRNAVKLLLLFWSWSATSSWSFMEVQGYPHTAGRHVCARDHYVNIPVQVSQSYCKPEYKRYVHSCTNNYYGMCSSFRLTYQLAYRQVYKNHLQKQRVYTCCRGWERSTPYTTSCMKPVCTNGCGSGRCVQPDRCKCPPGWKGEDCKTDVDECKSSDHGCSQECVNTAGSYQCSCSDGFTLASDGKSCKFCLSCTNEYRVLNEKIGKLSTKVENLQQENIGLKNDIKALLYNSTIVKLESVELREFVTPETPLSTQTSKDPKSVITTTIAPAVPTTTMQSTRTSEEESEVPFILSTLKDIEMQMETFYSMSEQLSMLEERLSDCTCTGKRKRRNLKKKFWRS